MISNPVLAIQLHVLEWETFWQEIYKLLTHDNKTMVLLPATRTQETPISVWLTCRWTMSHTLTYVLLPYFRLIKYFTLKYKLKKKINE